MFNGTVAQQGMVGMPGGNAGGVNSLMYSLSGLLTNAQQATQQNLANLQSQGGMIDPVQMIQVQIQTQNYLTVVQTITSIVKQFGDLDKTIATNIGS